MAFEYVKGDEVVLRSRPDAGAGVVTEVIRTGGEPQYRVFFREGTALYSARHLDLAASQAGPAHDPVALLARGELADADAFRAFMTLAKLEKPLANNLYSFAASRTERLPHQFKAVLKLLQSPYSRLLIADEVGLGKTIEAGIILTELQARGTLDHVLVACPSPLTEKWRREMRERFLFDFEVLDGSSFREFIAADSNGPSPEPRRVIASLELMRRAENIAALGEQTPNLDVVIVDEAHHMRNLGTATNDLGDVLSSLADTVVFLTATPLNLGRDDFFNLMHLLVPEDFPQRDMFTALIEPNEHLNQALRHLRAQWPPRFDEALESLVEVESTAFQQRFLRSGRYLGTRTLLERGARGEQLDRETVVRCQRNLIELNTISHVFTRTRKREVQELFPTRRSATASVSFSPGEQAFYDAVTAWALETYDERAAHLVAATFQRLAASCLPALGRRLVPAVGRGTFLLGQDEVAEIAEVVPDDQEPLPEDQLVLEVEDESVVHRLLEAWRAYGGSTDTKFDGFSRALDDSFAAGAERILVFSYFTGTIDYLAERLEGRRIGGLPLRVLKLYGPMGREQRDRAVTEFRDSPGPVVLLSSEVGSEGLDFQFCSRMFNYDLPWNPMRVEQRIGRLDRYGQASEVIHIVNMIVAGTIEERIFYRLYDRIKIFESSIGDLEAILGDVEVDLGRLQRDALSGRLTDAELERRRNLIADVILRQQQDNEEFERESQRFLSNDDVFLELFNDIDKTRKYVTPVELQLLVEMYLDATELPVRLGQVAGRRGVFRLSGSIDQLRIRLSRALATQTSGARAARAFLARLASEGIDVTFDPAIATADRRLEFVSLHHPLIRAIATSPELAERTAACGSLALDIATALGGPHAFFVFQLEAHGMKDELELVAVVVGTELRIDEAAGTELLGALVDARTSEEPIPLNGDLAQAMHQAALEWMRREVMRREAELQTQNDERITEQVESLRLSGDRRALWLAQQIEEGRSEPIVRMRRSQLARLRDDQERKIVALEARRGVTVSYDLIAAGTLTPQSRAPARKPSSAAA
jgi:superfamily II DNA or RNA helicase